MYIADHLPRAPTTATEGDGDEFEVFTVELDCSDPLAYQTLLCRFEGLGREAVQAEQPGFVIGGTGTETIYQQTKWRTWLFSIWLSFDIVRFV